MLFNKPKLPHFFYSSLIIVMMTFFSASAYMSRYPAGRFINKVFGNVTKTSAVKFGSNTNPLNSNAAINLYFDVYEPAGDTCTSRPCIVCLYGGGFVGGDRTGSPGGGQDAQTFANYGYVGVAPDYRMWGANSKPNHQIWPCGFVVTAQDVRACIRYLRAHATTYKIDTSRIAISGCSSGAFIALNTAFMDKPSKIPSVVDTNIYGGIEGKSGTPGVNSKVCAAAGNSGAFLDTNWIEPGSVPYFGYQSTPDSWGVPTDTGTPAPWDYYWLFYGITPISVRLTHVGLLEGTVATAPNQHCPGGFVDASHMFFYNAMCEVGRNSGANTNLALNKTATQSSTNGNLAASRAVDGNTNGASSGSSYCLTNSSGQAWWQVDLGAEYIVDSIWAYNRTDSLVNHQINFDIKFGIDGTNWETCSYERAIMGAPTRYRIRGGVIGRYVRIQLRGTASLSLAEVQVWGRDTSNITGAMDNGVPSRSNRTNTAFSSSFLVKTDAGAFAIPPALRGTAASVSIYDLTGKLVRKDNVTGGKIRMNGFGGSAKTGIYVVRVSPAR